MATNQEFIENLYKHVLLRSPDSGGLAYYIGQMNAGASRADVLASFGSSSELAGPPTELAGVYQACLGRQPDIDGLQYWAGRYYAGRSLAQIADDMLHSSEFTVSYPEATNHALVIDQIYQNSLGRSADPGGLAYYEDRVAGGMSLGAVAEAIALSAEGKGRNALAMQKTLLWHAVKGTEPTPGEIKGLPDDISAMAATLTATTDPGVFWESGSVLYGTAAIEAPLFLDLATKTLTLDGDYQGLSSGTLGAVRNIDFSKLTADPDETPTITVKGNDQANTYIASDIGDIFEGRGGNDVIHLGAGKDTVIFSSTATGNGLDEIRNFSLSTDLLDLSKFLNKTLGTIRLVPVDAGVSSGVRWGSGDIIAVSGASLTTPNAIASLFGTVLANPTGPGTAVVISADVVGDACVWFVSNTGSGNPVVIDAGEVSQAAILKGVNNLLDINALDSLKVSTGVSLTLGELHYSATGFSEDLANNGRVISAITINLYGDKFVGVNGRSIGAVTNVPAGLTAKLIKQSDTRAELQFVGNATGHTFADSISDLTVTFSDSEFLSGQAALDAVRDDLSVTFYDIFAEETGSTLTVYGGVSRPLVIDKSSNTITSDGKIIGTIGPVNTFDLSKIIPPSASVEVIGSTAHETFISAPHGATIRGGGGNDTIYAGAGVDRIIFDPLVSGFNHNGIDTIHNFKVGTGGDILGFSSFLGSPGTTNMTPVLDTDSNKPCANGDVLVVQGTAAIHSAASVAALFGTSGTTTYTLPGGYTKLVVITSDTTGDAHIWYVYDESIPGVVNPNTEVTLVGVLKDVSNLSYYQLDPSNIA
ncbi:MAG: DUF4214 domain-containing protein [Desulfovibrionales bacterium]|nr:DUF4214 domain-containing protein [Desulfovibrionales bacterium]